MRRVITVGLVVLTVTPLVGQTRKPPARKPAPAPAATTKKIAPDTICPAPLGVGLTSHEAFCEVMAGRDPAGGVLITIPSHKGSATLTFDLHNLHLYSEEQVKAHRAYARYMATIGVLTMDNTLLTRAMVLSEFRTAADLLDRISGGAGPAGVKAVAPTGTESISVAIPEGEDQISLLGEKLLVESVSGTATYSQAGRPIAAVSNMMLEYRPAPPKPVKKSR